MAEDRAKCFAIGCDAFESKPVNFERLLVTMRKLLPEGTQIASQSVGNYQA